MKRKEIEKALNVKESAFDEHRFNPLRVVLNEEWDSKFVPGEVDYRERAIKRCLDARVEFVSEFNTLTNLIHKCIKVINPLNGNEMVTISSGGTAAGYTFSYKDEETGDTVQLTVNEESIRISPKK